MIIKNRAKLERKHPNYSKEIEIISSVVNGAVGIINTDVVGFYSENFPNYSIDVKNYFLSNQAKELSVYDENNKCMFSQHFQKDGSCFSYIVFDPKFLSIICKADVADKISIGISFGSHFITFDKEGVYDGDCNVTAQNGQPVLERYTIDWR